MRRKYRKIRCTEIFMNRGTKFSNLLNILHLPFYDNVHATWSVRNLCFNVL
jgi:hypothetical protein